MLDHVCFLAASQRGETVLLLVVLLYISHHHCVLRSQFPLHFINPVKACVSLSVSVDIHLSFIHTHTHSVRDTFNMQRQDRETLMRRGFTMVTAGVVTSRPPRLDGLYRRAGQLE